jgi:hypothetical protein
VGPRFDCLSSRWDLERNADRQADTRIPAVVHVVPIVLVDHVNVVGLVPVICPIAGPWVNKAEPIATVLKAGISADNHVRLAEDDEPMAGAKVARVTVVWNAVAVVSAALLPRAVVRLPVSRSMSLPCCVLDTLLLLGVARRTLDILPPIREKHC